MNKFTYRSAEEKQNIEAILKQRKRKINMQQIISAVIFIAISATILLYLGFHTYYTEYDGYVQVDANKVRTPFDIYLDSVYVNVGDFVAPGDTLYSYYNIDQLVDYGNPVSEPTILTRNRDIQLRYQTLSTNIAVLRVRIEELKKQIATEDHNISYGLSSNSHKLDLERELKECIAQLEAMLRELGRVGAMASEVKPAFSHYGGTTGNRQQIYDYSRSDLLPAAKSYHLSSDSSIVTDLMAPDRMIFFKKEEIMTTQHIDLEANNLQVVAYIPIDKMRRIHVGAKAKCVINSDFSFTAHVKVLGLRTEEIPENLRSYFSKKNTSLIALLNIDPGQTMPLWNTASGLPVRVRIRNLDTWKRKPYELNYLWYTTGKGIRVDDDTVYHTFAKPIYQDDTLKQIISAHVRGKATDSVATPSPAAATMDNPAAVKRYCLIAFNFKNKDSADKALAQLQRSAPGAQLIQTGKSYKGVIESFDTRSEAQAALNKWRPKPGMAEVWIYDTENPASN